MQNFLKQGDANPLQPPKSCLRINLDGQGTEIVHLCMEMICGSPNTLFVMKMIVAPLRLPKIVYFYRYRLKGPEIMHDI